MKAIRWMLCAAVLATLAVPLVVAAAEQKGEMQSGMMMKPTAETEMLQKSVGTWNAVQKLWMDPSKPPVQGSGKMVCESINKGLWVGSSYNGDMMGMPFEGHEMIGWDPMKKKFVGAWSDNLGMGLYTYEGTASEDGKTITFTMTGPDETGTVTQSAMVMNVIDDNHHRMSMWRGMDTKQQPSMIIDYTRDTDAAAPKAMKGVGSKSP